MPYQKHDKDNAEVNPGTLLDRNAYERYDLNNVEASPQPSSEVESTDYGDQFRNWDADFVARDSNGDEKYPDVPIVIDTEAGISAPDGFPGGVSRVQEVLTGTAAVYSGGTGTVSVVSAFACKDGSINTRDLSSWTLCNEYSADAVQTITPQPSDADSTYAFISLATDDAGVTKVSISEDIFVYSIHQIDIATTTSGFYKAGETIDITVASASGGIPNINYLLQARFSDTGTGNWGNQDTIKQNCLPGEVVSYVIPSEMVGKYIQIRTRTRDNSGQGGSDIYIQKQSNAPISAAPIVDVVSVTGTTTLSGDIRVGEVVTLETIPTFSGGYPPVKHEYQFQMSSDESTWVGIGSPFVEYDPNNFTPGSITLTVPIGVNGMFIRLQTRATDALGDNVIAQGTHYGPVVPQALTVASPSVIDVQYNGQTDDLGTPMVGDIIKIDASAQFTGGVTPYTSKTCILTTNTGKEIIEFSDPDNQSEMEYTLTYDEVGDLLSVRTIVVDGGGRIGMDENFIYDKNNARGVLDYEPELERVQRTQVDRTVLAGRTVNVTTAIYSGGLGGQFYHLLARRYSTPDMTSQEEQVTIKSNAAPGVAYEWTVPSSWEGDYVKIVTRVRDNSNTDPFKQKFDFLEIGQV